MSEDKIWYIALNDEQVGPLSQDEVRAEIEAGQVTGSTYIWRDGLEDWVMAADAPEFSDVVEAGEPDIADVAGESVDAFFASYDTPADDEDEDAAAASVAAASVAASADPEPEPTTSSTPSGVVASPVAQRSDDSVLFSLDELAQTTQAASAPTDDTTDGSGLIDLSALVSTSSTMGSADTDGAAASSASTSGGAAPVTTTAPIALAPPKKSVLPMVLLGVAALAIIGLLVAIFMLLGNKDEAPPVAEGESTEEVADKDAADAADADAEKDADDAAAADADAEDAEQADAEDAEEEDTPEEPEEPEAPEEPAAAASASKKSSSSSSSASKSSGSSSKSSSSKSSSRSSSSSSKSSSSKSSSSSSSGSSGSGDSVSAALASISGDDDKKSSSSSSGGSRKLSDSQIRSTVRRYNSKVQGCKKSDDDAGTYRVAFAINANGRTSQVSPRTSGAAGSCVADVVKTMRFPEFDGDARKLTYTFAIR